jgi:hypothetical protein
MARSREAFLPRRAHPFGCFEGCDFEEIEGWISFVNPALAKRGKLCHRAGDFTMIRPCPLPLALFVLMALVVAAGALEIKETIWGFDGQAVAGRFNLLSLRVANPSPKPYDGEMLLVETRGLDSVVGAPYVQPVYVAPGTERWVQYVPFVASEFEWQIRWGRSSKERAVINAPRLGAPASVLLLDPSSPFAAGARLKAFPAPLFPTSVAATDGLAQVALDHVPRWEAARRQAFLDWVRRGGVVHVLKGPGDPVQFADDLAALESPARVLRVGAGRVVRHEKLRAEFGDEHLKEAGFPPLERASGGGGGAVIYRPDQSLLRSLSSLTKPSVPWPLLYVLTIAYLVVIGPVHYRWARKVDYRVALAGFLGTVAVFAVAFIVTGRRGSGEKQVVHSISVAQHLGDGRWDVRSWNSAFATSGDYYRLRHRGESNYYSATHDSESVNGAIYAGREGRLEVDIPLYSSRAFMHRGVLSGPQGGITLAKAAEGELEFILPDGWKLEPMEAWARREGRMIPLSKKGGRLRAAGGTAGVLRSEFFASDHLNAFNQHAWNSDAFDPVRVFRVVLGMYAGNVAGYEGHITAWPRQADQLEVFILSKAPAEFAMDGKGFTSENGWVISVHDVFLEPGGTTPTEPSPAVEATPIEPANPPNP